MKTFRLISLVALVSAAGTAAAAAPAPEYMDPVTGQYVVRANIAREVPSLVWAFGPAAPAAGDTRVAGQAQPGVWALERAAQYRPAQVQMAGFQPGPWAVERSAYIQPPVTLAGSDAGDPQRGRL